MLLLIKSSVMIVMYIILWLFVGFASIIVGEVSGVVNKDASSRQELVVVVGGPISMLVVLYCLMED